MMGSLKIHEQIRNGGGKRSMEREEMNGGAGTSRRKPLKAKVSFYNLDISNLLHM